MNNKRKRKIAALAVATIITSQSIYPIFALENEKITADELQPVINEEVILDEQEKEDINNENIETVQGENEDAKNGEIPSEEIFEEEVTKEEVNEELEENNTSKVDLRIMATTDLHANLMDHDYYTDKPNQNFGLTKTTTLIKESRAEADKNKNATDDIDNSILLDNGDNIQGNPLATVYAVKNKVKPGEKYPVYEAMDSIGYDAIGMGNHEFNYGLDFIKQITDPSVMNSTAICSNVYDAKTGEHVFKPYKIIEETVIDSNGKEEKIKIGVMSFVPQQILNWDGLHLNGKVTVKDIVESAKEITNELKDKTDVVVALSHSGKGSEAHTPGSENATLALTKVDGIDAIVAGHSHSTMQETVNGVQIVQPSNWGKELGIIDLKLTKENEEWKVIDEESKVERKSVEGKANDADMVKLVQKYHEETIGYVNGPVGKTTEDLNSFFSLVADDPSVQIVADAQKWFVEKKIKEGQSELQNYKELPILSVAAPFKAGGREFNDPSYFVDIEKGDLAVKDLSNLYIYDNTLTVTKITGAEVKEWLEMASGMFNTIDPKSKDEQELLNSNFRSYNFDVIEGITYEIDVTKYAKYNSKGDVINPNSERIKNIKFEGKDLDLKKEFLVVTNNYRAGGGGGFPGLDESKVVYASSDENREAITAYIQEKETITPKNDKNWKIKSVDSDAKVVFNSHSKGKNYLGNYPYIKAEKTDGDLTKYSYDLKEEYTKGETLDLQILSFNDLHGQYDASKYGGGIANLSAYLKQLQGENENTITMSAGDNIGGSPAVAALKQDQPTLEIMEEMNVDIVTTGNHEYDEGTDELARLIQGGTHASGLKWEGSKLDWTTSNVVAKKDMKFGNKDIKKGEPILDPYKIKEVDGVKVGVIGVVTTDTAKKVVPAGIKNVEFIDEVEAINKYSKELQKQGVKTIVVLSHVPAKTDKETNKLIDLSGDSDVYNIVNNKNLNEEVDVIIGADNHDYANSKVIREGKDDIIVTQAYSKGTNIGDIDLVIDRKTGDVIESSAEILTVDPNKITPDAKVLKMVEKAKEDVASDLERKVGFVEEMISRSIQGKNGEAELGRMVAEAQLWAVRDKGEAMDISLMNIGGVRADLEKGDITYEDIYTIQPFGNDLTKLELTGAQLKEILEDQEINDWVVGMQEGKSNRPTMLQIDGFTYKWHPEKVGDKWVVKVDSMNLNDKNKTKINQDTKLNTVANIFLAQGGDGFDTFKETEYEVVMGDLEAFEKYTEEFSKKDNNNNGTLGLNKIDVESNPNIINLDQNFDGNIDNPNNGGNDNNGGDNNGNGNGGNDNNGGDNNGNGNGGNDNNGGDNNGSGNGGNDDNGGNSNGNGNNNSNVNNPITGDSSVLGYVAVGATATVGLMFNLFRRKRK